MKTQQLEILPDEAKGAAAVAEPPKDERKRIGVAFEVKAESIDEDGRTFSGLASTWDMDLGGDVIHKGAFKKTLKDWKESKSPLPLLDSHNHWTTVRSVIGKMVDAKETDDGLEATFSVIDGPDGDEIWRRIKGGYVTGLSIGYRPVKIEMPTEEEERNGVWRHLKEVALREVSVVLYPMNPGAQIDQDSMKAAIAALKATAEKRALTAEEKVELTELQTHIKALLEDDQEEHAPAEEPGTEADPPAQGKGQADEPGEVEGELAPDDPQRTELERKLTEIRLHRHGTRVGRFARAATAGPPQAASPESPDGTRGG